MNHDKTLILLIITLLYIVYYAVYIDHADRYVSQSLFTHDMFISFKNWAYNYLGKENTMSNEYTCVEFLLYHVCVIWVLLLIPFKTGGSRNPMMYVLDAFMYNAAYSVQTGGYQINKYDCKMEWYRMFTKHNVNTPRVVGVYDASTRTYDDSINPMDPNKRYILKPLCGGLGVNVMPFEERSKLTDGKYIIQERVFVCDNDRFKTWHLRITTIRNKTNADKVDILSVYAMGVENNKDLDDDKIPSNHAQNAKVFQVNLSNTRYMREITSKSWKETFINTALLNRVCHILCDFHRRTFTVDQTITMGWDVMMDCNTYYVLEGNICSSLLFIEDVKLQAGINKIRNRLLPQITRKR